MEENEEWALSLAIATDKPIEEVERLLEAGANPEGDGIHDIPLMEAVSSKQEDIVRLLLEWGACPVSMLDDLPMFAMHHHRPSMWVILEYASAVTRARVFYKMYVERDIEGMIKYVERGYLSVLPKSVAVQYPPIENLPNIVKECVYANRALEPWPNMQVILDKLGPMCAMISMDAGPRFFPVAARNTHNSPLLASHIGLIGLVARDQERKELYTMWVRRLSQPWSVSSHDWFSDKYKTTVKTVHFCMFRLRSIEGHSFDLPVEMWWWILRMMRRF